MLNETKNTKNSTNKHRDQKKKWHRHGTNKARRHTKQPGGSGTFQESLGHGASDVGGRGRGVIFALLGSLGAALVGVDCRCGTFVLRALCASLSISDIKITVAHQTYGAKRAGSSSASGRTKMAGRHSLSSIASNVFFAFVEKEQHL